MVVVDARRRWLGGRVVQRRRGGGRRDGRLRRLGWLSRVPLADLNAQLDLAARDDRRRAAVAGLVVARAADDAVRVAERVPHARAAHGLGARARSASVAFVAHAAIASLSGTSARPMRSFEVTES